jgi:hypothetical protein
LQVADGCVPVLLLCPRFSAKKQVGGLRGPGDNALFRGGPSKGCFELCGACLHKGAGGMPLERRKGRGRSFEMAGSQLKIKQCQTGKLVAGIEVERAPKGLFGPNKISSQATGFTEIAQANFVLRVDAS